MGTLNNRCSIIIGTQKGTIILTTTLLEHHALSTGVQTPHISHMPAARHASCGPGAPFVFGEAHHWFRGLGISPFYRSLFFGEAIISWHHWVRGLRFRGLGYSPFYRFLFFGEAIISWPSKFGAKSKCLLPQPLSLFIEAVQRA